MWSVIVYYSVKIYSNIRKRERREREGGGGCVCASTKFSLFDLDLNYKSVRYFGVYIFLSLENNYLSSIYLNVIKIFFWNVLKTLEFFEKVEREKVKEFYYLYQNSKNM